VLNGSTGRVGADTRERVLAAARELGYVPNAAARSLRAGRSGIVLMDNPNIVWGPLFSEFMIDLRTHLHAPGYIAVVYGARSRTRRTRWRAAGPSCARRRCSSAPG
jgi:DNA-binding LacI/PurR family transcriptional regulator